MDNFVEGSVVIVETSQAGTVVQISGKSAWVLLRNSDVWVGPAHGMRFPQDQADLDSAPLDVERFEGR